MYSLSSAPFAKFLELYLTLNFFLIFGRPVVGALAGATCKFY